MDKLETHKHHHNVSTRVAVLALLLVTKEVTVTNVYNRQEHKQSAVAQPKIHKMDLVAFSVFKVKLLTHKTVNNVFKSFVDKVNN